MKRNTKLAIFILGALLTSCGQQDDSKTDEQTEKDKATYAQYVDDQNKDDEIKYFVQLPKCDKNHEERLIYIPEEQSFLVCRKAQWMYLSLDSTSDIPEVDKCEAVKINPQSDQENDKE